jgi:hypothetical protein
MLIIRQIRYAIKQLYRFKCVPYFAIIPNSVKLIISKHKFISKVTYLLLNGLSEILYGTIHPQMSL